MFSALEAHYVRSLRLAIREQSWQWMDEIERELFLQEHLPEEIVAVYGDLLCDFRQGSYRILGDLICDIDDAIEQGALRDNDIPLPPSLLKTVAKEAPNIRTDILSTLIAYYIANRQSDTDWAELPVSSFDAYFGTTSFSRKILNTIPETILVRDRSTCGVSRYKVAEEVLLLVEDI